MDELYNQLFEFGTIPATDITQFVKWTVNNYVIAFNMGGGSRFDSVEYSCDKIMRLKDLIRKGYTFDGWYAVKLPNGQLAKVTSTADGAYAGDEDITSVTIGSGVKSIGENAFKGCRNLKRIKIKTKKLTLKRIGSNAFKGVSAEVNVTLPKSKKKLYKKILRKRGLPKKALYG